MTLGRRSSAAAARFLSAVRRTRRLALSACGRWRGRFLSGGGYRRAALTAPLPAAPRWRSWRRLSRAAALATAWRSAAAIPWRRLALGAVRSAQRLAPCVWSLARSLLLWGRLPLRGAHSAAACGAALVLLTPASSCRRTRGSVAHDRRFPRRRLALSARCVMFGGSRSLRVVVGAVASSLWGGRRRAALTAPLPAASRWRSWRQLSRAAANVAA